MNKSLWKNRKVLITGYNGFKGTWLTLWLKNLGADVSGIALAPQTETNHWDLLNLDIKEHHVDLRDAAAVRAVIDKEQPETVFHLAAQALVRRSYHDPLETWSTNVMGTVNVLEACRTVRSMSSIIVATSDKCYENTGQERGYQETDPLGGHDPYSASKAATELVASSYRSSWLAESNILLATVRAGNVIGGGDWSQDRLFPDLVRAAMAHETLIIRSPEALRPWQHVLEPLRGYLLLAEKLIMGEKSFATAWNFGPGADAHLNVREILNTTKILWPALRWEKDAAPQPHEAARLWLDSTKSETMLDWHPVWGIDECLRATVEWYRQFYERKELTTQHQLESYIKLTSTTSILAQKKAS
jgi:CDP-glucose 4,6-dehydratase